MYCSSHVANVWEHLIARSQLPVVDWRWQKTRRPAEEAERENEGERERESMSESDYLNCSW